VRDIVVVLALCDPLALSADVAGRRDLGLLKLTPSHLMVVNHVTALMA